MRSFAHPQILPGERSLWLQNHSAVILALFFSLAPLFLTPHLFLSLSKASKCTWIWRSLNTPWSRSALCLGSLRLLLTHVPALPGCSGCPDAQQPHGDNPFIDGAEGSAAAAAPSTHLLCAGLGVQLWDGVILPSAICPHRSQPLLTQLSHTSGPSSLRPLQLCLSPSI